MKQINCELGYELQIRPLLEEDGGGYEAVFPQLGRMIVGLGETRDEALHDLLGSIPPLLESLAEHGENPPEPEQPAAWMDYSGRVTLRIPKMLHHQLDRLADREGVSLNTLMTTALQSAATALAAGSQFGAVSSAEAAPPMDLFDAFRLNYEAMAAAALDKTGESRAVPSAAEDRWQEIRNRQRHTVLPEGWEVQEAS